MLRHLKILAFFLAILAVELSSGAGAAASQMRVALVIGNASYTTKPLPTAANDAALIPRRCKRRALTSSARATSMKAYSARPSAILQTASRRQDLMP